MFYIFCKMIWSIWIFKGNIFKDDSIDYLKVEDAKMFKRWLYIAT